MKGIKVMADIFKILREQLKDKYDFRVEIESIGFTVILSKEMYEDDFEIPITYGFEEFAYVNFDKLDKHFKETEQSLNSFDYGFDSDDIKAINTIMDCMYNCSDEIVDLMGYCDKN